MPFEIAPESDNAAFEKARTVDDVGVGQSLDVDCKCVARHQPPSGVLFSDFLKRRLLERLGSKSEELIFCAAAI